MNHEISSPNEVKYLEWDTHFFGFSIGRIYAKGLSAASLEERLENASGRNIKFVEVFCDISDEESVYSLERSGFHLGDVRITLTKKLDGDPIGDSALNDLIFKKSDREDTNRLKTISHGLFTCSRYYRYPKFDRNKVDLMFQIWIEKAIGGELDDELYYICNETDVLAFCSIKYKGNEASIGLFGVNTSQQGKGLGSQILKQVFQLLYKRGVTGLNVVTQGNNIGALRLYQKNGFHISTVTMSYYKWLE